MNKLPVNWIETTIQEINLHKAKNITPDRFPNEMFELYSVPIFPTGKPEAVLGKDIGSSKQEVEPDDVLLCKINPRINRVWRVGERNKNRQIASSEWINIRNRWICSDYLRYAFSRKDFRDLLCSEVAGVGGSLTRAQPKKVANYPIPLAPINEQIRIANKLDSLLAKVDAAQTHLEKIPTLLKRFRQSVLAAATSGELTSEWRLYSDVTPLERFLLEIQNERNFFKSLKKLKKNFANMEVSNELFKNKPESWKWLNFDSIAENENNALKAGPFGSALKKQDCVDAGFKVYGQEQVIAGDESLVTYFVNEDKYRELNSCKVKAGDILISLVGTIGKVLVLSENVKDGIINPRLVKITLQKEINRNFIKMFLDSPHAHRFFKSFSHGGTMDILNLNILRQLPICLPPIEEQKEIVRRVESLFALADSVEKQYLEAKKRTDRITQSLLAKAFRGELVPQDPNDELASELLKRIQAEREQEVVSKPKRKPATKKWQSA